MKSTSFQQQKTKKIKKELSISNWVQQVNQDYPEKSQEFNNSIWVVLSYVLEHPKSWLLAHGDERISSDQFSSLNHLIHRLSAGEPLAYLIEKWSFFGLDFFVDKSVLIPRPETELLVEKAIAWLRINPNARTIADIGTGSGCIAITLAANFPDRDFIATDIAHVSINVARKNTLLHNTKNVYLIEGDLMNCLDVKFNLVCANPPYIQTEVLKILPVSQHEPKLALDGGESGLVTITRFLEESIIHMEKNAAVLMEIESTKADLVLSLARNYFPMAEIQIHNDLAGHARLLMIQTH